MKPFKLRSAFFSLLAPIVVALSCQTSGLTPARDPGAVADAAPGPDAAQCRAVNEACSYWSDCCSGLCGQGTCRGGDGAGGSGGVDVSGSGGVDVSGSGGAGGAGGADASTTNDAQGTPPWRPSTCDDPELGQIPNTDEATVAKLVVGKWFDCDPLSMFQTSDDIGIEIVDDTNWYKLYWTGSEVVRGVGFGKQGTWMTVSGGICCTVSLNAEGARGGLSIFPAFATSPRKMQVNTSAGGFATLATGGN